MDGKLTQEEALRLLRARTLSVWEDAALLREYIRLCGITQSECAVRLGRSQSSVANRLRLLRLTSDERRAMQEAGLSERHARALLRLGDAVQRQAALRTVTERHLSVAETEGYVETLLRPAETAELGRAARGGAPSARCGHVRRCRGIHMSRRALRYALFSRKRCFSMILCFTSGGECGRIIKRLTAALSFRPPFSRYLAAREAKIRKGSKLL